MEEDSQELLWESKKIKKRKKKKRNILVKVNINIRIKRLGIFYSTLVILFERRLRVWFFFCLFVFLKHTA